MSDITRKAIEKMMSAFVAKPNRARVDLYVERLSQFDSTYVERACEKIIDSRKSLPPISDVRELVTYLRHQDAPREPEPEVSEEQLDQLRDEALDDAQGLERHKSILGELDSDLKKIGLVGEEMIVKIVYLAVLTRLFSKPVNIAIKGPSASGKSEIAKVALGFHPQDAALDMAGMSARHLAYTDDDFSHRFLYVWEAAGLGEDAEAMLRVLLSEGCIKWRTVVDQQGVTLFKPGPTGLLVTTTAITVHPENETRVLSLTTDDTKEQTKKIMEAIAKQTVLNEVDFVRWHGLARWVALGNTAVYVPFAQHLAEKIPAISVRLRRDFSVLLGLVEANALLHRANRVEDDEGRIIATIGDYSTVRDLVSQPMNAMLETEVDQKIRDTVDAVAHLIAPKIGETAWASNAEVTRELDIDKGSTSRRLAAAVEAGYLDNIARSGRPKYVIGVPLPHTVKLLPEPAEIERAMREPRHAGRVDHGGVRDTQPVVLAAG